MSPKGRVFLKIVLLVLIQRSSTNEETLPPDTEPLPTEGSVIDDAAPGAEESPAPETTNAPSEISVDTTPINTDVAATTLLPEDGSQPPPVEVITIPALQGDVSDTDTVPAETTPEATTVTVAEEVTQDFDFDAVDENKLMDSINNADRESGIGMETGGGLVGISLTSARLYDGGENHEVVNYGLNSGDSLTPMAAGAITDEDQHPAIAAFSLRSLPTENNAPVPLLRSADPRLRSLPIENNAAENNTVVTGFADPNLRSLPIGNDAAENDTVVKDIQTLYRSGDPRVRSLPKGNNAAENDTVVKGNFDTSMHSMKREFSSLSSNRTFASKNKPRINLTTVVDNAKAATNLSDASKQYILPPTSSKNTSGLSSANYSSLQPNSFPMVGIFEGTSNETAGFISVPPNTPPSTKRTLLSLIRSTSTQRSLSNGNINQTLTTTLATSTRNYTTRSYVALKKSTTKLYNQNNSTTGGQTLGITKATPVTTVKKRVTVKNTKKSNTNKNSTSIAGNRARKMRMKPKPTNAKKRANSSTTTNLTRKKNQKQYNARKLSTISKVTTKNTKSTRKSKKATPTKI